MTRAVVLFAHGARNPQWSAPLFALRQALTQRGVVATIGYLELQQPDFAAAIDSLPDGVTQIDVLPVFWAEAGHVRNELPSLIANAQARHAGLAFRVLPVLSEIPGLIDYLAGFAAGAAEDSGTG